MALKYQNEIDSLNLTITCPFNTYEPDEKEAFRWVYNPITHDDNFLPNIKMDRKDNPDLSYEGREEPFKCLRCGASMFAKLEVAKRVWATINRRNKGNLKLNYTHIAHGVLVKGDALLYDHDTNHFGVYENEGADLKAKFTIVDTIS